MHTAFLGAVAAALIAAAGLGAGYALARPHPPPAPTPLACDRYTYALTQPDGAGCQEVPHAQHR